jgi:O-antigen ligase
MIVISTATTGFIALALGFIIVFFIWISKGINKRTLIFIASMTVIVIVACIVFKDILAVFVGRLFGGDLDGASGGRIGGYIESLKVWLDKPLFGVGPGNYGEYFGQDNSYVPSNVTLELLATVGLPATICFYALTFSLIVKARKINKEINDYLSNLLYACALGLLVFTVVLQINQGYLRLYHWMIFGVLSGGINYLKKRQRAKKD